MIAKYLTEALARVEQASENLADHLSEWQAACNQVSNILQAMGLFEASLWWAAIASESEPEWGQVYYNLGELYAFVEQWTLASAAYEKAKSLTNHAATYTKLASVYYQLGETEKAVESGYQAFSLSSEAVTAQNCYKMGRTLLKQKKIDEAINCHQKAITEEPTFTPSYYELSEIFIAQKKWEKAKNCYEQLLEIEPNQAKAYYKLGMFWLKQNKLEEGMVAFREAIQIQPNFIAASRELIKILLRLQQWDDAIAACRTLMTTTQNYPWLQVYLGNCFAKKENFDQASFHFQEACALRGWQLCRDHQYYFTQDNFSYKIPRWQSYFEPLAHQAGIQALEIGNFQGMSACWLLDQVLTDASARLVCIEKAFTEPFLANITKTKSAEKVQLLEGKNLKILATLDVNTYDVINIQDGRKKADYIQENAVLCWKLLKVGGFLIFNEYQPKKSANQSELKLGIDNFLKSVASKIEILDQSNYVILKKIAL